MKIVIDGADLQRVIKVCKPCISQDPIRPALMLIELDCVGGVGYATALDGVKMIQTRFEYDGDDGVMLIPPFNGFDKYKMYEIESADGRVSIDDGETKIIRRAYDGGFIDWRAIAAKNDGPDFTIGVNAGYLKKVLSAAGGYSDVVVLDFYGKLGGFFVRGAEAVGMVLPVRMHGGRQVVTARTCEKSKAKRQFGLYAVESLTPWVER